MTNQCYYGAEFLKKTAFSITNVVSAFGLVAVCTEAVGLDAVLPQQQLIWLLAVF